MNTTGKTSGRKSAAGPGTTRRSTRKSEAPADQEVALRAYEFYSKSARKPTHDEIAIRAHELYVQSGYQAGRDVEFWLEAERQLRRGRKT
jgi:hypothetical protein